MRIGAFGGTFDPPHIAHLILAAEALDQLDLKRILWLLTPYPPHKTRQRITPVEQRLEMVRATIAENEAFELSRADIDRSPPHFTVDTMELLAAQNPGAELVFLMGEDSLNDLPTWHKPGEFLGAVHSLGVMHRPGREAELAQLERWLPGISEKVTYIRAPLLEVSASDIRQRIAEGRPYRYFLTPQVYRIILEGGLYREDG